MVSDKYEMGRRRSWQSVLSDHELGAPSNYFESFCFGKLMFPHSKLLGRGKVVSSWYLARRISDSSLFSWTVATCLPPMAKSISQIIKLMPSIVHTAFSHPSSSSCQVWATIKMHMLFWSRWYTVGRPTNIFDCQVKYYSRSAKHPEFFLSHLNAHQDYTERGIFRWRCF